MTGLSIATRPGAGRVPCVEATLYSLELSHPALAAHRMLEVKSVDHRVVNLLPGLHPVPLRRGGFPGPTVPALRIDGRRIPGIEGNLQDSR